MSKALLIAFALLACGGCIYDDMSDCPPDNGGGGGGNGVSMDREAQLSLRAFQFGTDRTDPANDRTLVEIEAATLYLFTPEGEYIRENHILREDLPYNVGFILEDYPYDQVMISAWGNLDNHVDVHKMALHESSSTYFIRMLDTGVAPGLHFSPGDLFFGVQMVNAVPLRDAASREDEAPEVQTIWITQKNARLNVTVRGLPRGDDSDYYIDIDRLNQGYDFMGNVYTDAADPSSINSPGKFRDNGDFISREPEYLIHDFQNLNLDNSMILGVNRADGTPVVTGDQVTEEGGEIINLRQGMTTNVLITLNNYPVDGTGDLDVRVSVTPWDEVEQWTSF